MFMTISTFPVSELEQAEVMLHPLLLHRVHKGSGRRFQELEPMPSSEHWRQTFTVNTADGTVEIINRCGPLDEDRTTVPKYKVLFIVNHYPYLES